MPPRPLRRAGLAGADGVDRRATHAGRRGRHRARVAVRPIAAVRLDRGLHVRGRRAARGAARGRAVAGPRPAPRAARLRGAARAARPGRARRGGARAATARRRAACASRRRRARPAARSRPAHERRDRGAGRRRSGRRGRAARAERRVLRVPVAGGRRGGRRGRRRGCATRSASRSRRASPARSPSPLRTPSRSRARYARTHGPSPPETPSGGSARMRARVRAALEALAADGRVVHGEFRPGGVEREWCDVDVLRRMRRRSLAALRREVEPVDAAAFGRFLPAWQGVDRPPPAGPDALTEALARLQGAADPGVGPRARRPARRGCAGTARPTSTRWRPAASSCGSARGALGADDGRVALCSATRRRRSRRRRAEDPPDGDAARRDPRAPRRSAAPRSGPISSRRRAPPTSATVLRALWDLVWAGEVTNDTSRPCARSRGRHAGVAHRAGARAATRAAAAQPGRPPAPDGGRWSRRSSRADAGAHRARARPRRAATRPLRRRDPRGRARRGHARRVRRRLPGAAGDGGVRQGAPRLLRRRSRRGPVRACPGAVDRLRDLRERPGAERRGAACSRPPIPPSRTAPRCPGRRPPGGQRAPPARSSCWSTARRPPISNGAPRRCSRSATPTRSTWADALAALAKDGRLRAIELRQIDGGLRRAPLRRRRAVRRRLRRRVPRPDAPRLRRPRAHLDLPVNLTRFVRDERLGRRPPPDLPVAQAEPAPVRRAGEVSRRRRATRPARGRAPSRRACSGSRSAKIASPSRYSSAGSAPTSTRVSRFAGSSPEVITATHASDAISAG